MKVYEGLTFAEVYHKALYDVYYKPEYECSPRGQSIKEITNAAFVIEDPIKCLYTNPKRSSQFNYIAAELLWYFAGRNDVGFIKKYAKFWEQIANEKGELNSAYGNLILRRRNTHGISQWQWAYDCLKKDKDSRQSILHFNTPEHQYFDNKDFVCTLSGIFQIRDNKLNFTVEMRSNDIILGTATDISFFCLLQQQMLKLLKEDCYSDLELGTYTHIIHSLHVYERHFQLVEEMLKVPIFEAVSFPEIDNNFIKLDGSMTPEFEMIHDAVSDNEFIETNDEMFNWIVEKTINKCKV